MLSDFGKSQNTVGFWAQIWAQSSPTCKAFCFTKSGLACGWNFDQFWSNDRFARTQTGADAPFSCEMGAPVYIYVYLYTLYTQCTICMHSVHFSIHCVHFVYFLCTLCTICTLCVHCVQFVHFVYTVYLYTLCILSVHSVHLMYTVYNLRTL